MYNQKHACCLRTELNIKLLDEGMILCWPNIRLEVTEVMEEVKKNVTQRPAEKL